MSVSRWERAPGWVVEVVYRLVDPVIHARPVIARYGCGWTTLCLAHSWRHRDDIED